VSYSLTIRLPEALGRQLEAAAGDNKSRFVREAITDRLERQATPANPAHDWRQFAGSMALPARDYTNAGMRRLIRSRREARSIRK